MKKYEKILLDAANMVGKIPKVNQGGATATVTAYVSAYKDYSEACYYLGIIANNIEQIESLNKTINKYKNEEGYDIDGLQYSIKQHSNSIAKAYKELKEFITEREEQKWC